MITKEIIDRTYKKFRSRPASPDQLNLPLLFVEGLDNHGIYVDEGELVVDSVGENSPFHAIPLRRIHGIVEFERYIAIVLEHAILFLRKGTDETHVHIKMSKPSVIDRIREKIKNPKHPDF